MENSKGEGSESHIAITVDEKTPSMSPNKRQALTKSVIDACGDTIIVAEDFP